MLGASLCFAASSIGIKFLGTRLPSLEIVFMRNVTGLLILAPIAMPYGWNIFRTTQPRLHISRIVCSALAINLAVYGLTHMHLATAISLGFTRPLFMIILAIILLGEAVGWRRSLATVIGFGGVLIIVGPTNLAVDPAMFAALGGAAFLAGAMILVRRQSAYDGPATIMAWASIGVCVLTAIPAFAVWQPPTLADWGLAAFLGITGSMSQYMMIRAFTYGEATVVNPVDYGQIIITTIVGYYFFGETPSVWMFVGTAIIVASTLYILLREAKLKKITPPPDP